MLFNIGSGNGLFPVWRQAIIWTNSDFLLTGTKVSEICIKMLNFEENAIENLVCKMTAILLGPQYILCASIQSFVLNGSEHLTN